MEIDQRNLSKIECGNNFITAETLSKILIALNVEPQELFSFKHHLDESIIKKEFMNLITSNDTDSKLLYKLYRAIKN